MINIGGINLIYIVSAFSLGILHALEPGHGKSLITTFVLSSTKNKKSDAFLIGLISSLTHTASVYFMGFIGIRIIEFLFPFNKEIFISIFASIIIFGIGSMLVWDRIIKVLFFPKYEHDCSAHKLLSKNVKATGILMIGLTAGLVPCSGGLAVFMTSTATYGSSEILLGFLYVLSFSLGLGFALSVVALFAIYGKNFLFLKLHGVENIEKSSGIISAILIYTIGLILTTYNMTNIIHTNPSSLHSNCHH